MSCSRERLVGGGEMEFIGRTVLARMVNASCVVAGEVTPQLLLRFAHVAVRVQMQLQVFHRAPEPFDEHIVVQRPLPTPLRRTPEAWSNSTLNVT